MDKKLKDILVALNNQIDSNELTAALKAESFEGEYALSEDGIASIVNQTKSLLSAESAVNNPVIIEKISKDLYPKHMKSALSKVEEQFKPILDKLGIDYTRYEFVSDAIKDIEPKLAQLANGDSQKIIASLNEDIRAAKEALTKREQEFEEQLRKRDEELMMDKLQQKFKAKATEKQWAEAYSIPDVQDAILSKIWNKVNAKAHLKLNEQGEVVLMQKDFPDKELYNGNKVETFQSLLEPEFEPFLKKSDATKQEKNLTLKVDDKLTPEQQALKAEWMRRKERA